MDEMRIRLHRDSLLHDIANLAYVIADIGGETHSPHALHQTFDICEGGNRERTLRILELTFREAALLLSHTAEARVRRGYYQLNFRKEGVTTAKALRIKELLRELLTSRVLEAWLAVTLPEAADPWRERAAEAARALAACSLTGRPTLRRSCPF